MNKIAMMLAWIRRLMTMVRTHDAQVTALKNRIEELEKIMRERTDIHVDLGFRNPNTVLIVGRYRDRDYFRVFDLPRGEMNGLIDHLHGMQRHGIIRTIDAPPAMSATFKREFAL